MVPAIDDKGLAFNGGIIWKVQAGLGATSREYEMQGSHYPKPKGTRGGKGVSRV